MLINALSFLFFLWIGFLSPESLFTDVDTAEAAEMEVVQAKPVVAYLTAIKENDTELFKSAYSKNVQQQLVDEEERGGDWQKILDYYTKITKDGMFGDGYGDYNLDDFVFTVTGSNSEGVVAIIYKGKQTGELDVIKENGVWKINEI